MAVTGRYGVWREFQLFCDLVKKLLQEKVVT